MRVRLGRMVVLLFLLMLLLLLLGFLLLFLLLFPAFSSLLFLANLHQLQPPLLMTDEHFMDKREEGEGGRRGMDREWEGEKAIEEDLNQVRGKPFVLIKKEDSSERQSARETKRDKDRDRSR